MVFTVIGFIYSILTNAAIVVGIAAIVRKRTIAEDCSSMLQFVSIPLIPLGIALLYMYGMEAFIAFYSGNKYEADAYQMRSTGRYWLAYALGLLAVVSTQIFWLSCMRRSAVAVLIVGVLNLVR